MEIRRKKLLSTGLRPRRLGRFADGSPPCTAAQRAEATAPVRQSLHLQILQFSVRVSRFRAVFTLLTTPIQSLPQLLSTTRAELLIFQRT